MTGNILKMRTEFDNPIRYYLPLSETEVYMNELLGKTIKLEYSGTINCVSCGRKTRSSFAQGYCFPCFQTLPETDDCILRPEMCKAHEGISRDMEWAEKHCLQDHYVYLALTSAVKVGITRSTQIPTRWIDQGAWKAIKLARVPNRNTAGNLEVSLKKHLTDKTNWRHMLANKQATEINLLAEKERISELLPKKFQEFISSDNSITELLYPVNQYPEKVKSIGFDKVPSYTGVLIGIRGQYLLFEDNSVLNIRKHGGYKIELSVLD